MSRSKAEPSPDRPHPTRKVTLKQRADYLKFPKDKDSKSEQSADTPSKGAHHHHHTNLQYENTFRMSPDEGKTFEPYKVENMMKEVLESKLKHERYHAESCSKLAQLLCAAIKDKAKEVGFHRYKLVTQVMLGQDSEQSTHLASRCLWNHSTDNFASATFRNNYLYCIAVVYGVYMD